MADRRIELDAHETIESFLDDLESSQRTELEVQKERAERGFREAQNGL